jgi:Flp pilus assembly protein TadD
MIGFLMLLLVFQGDLTQDRARVLELLRLGRTYEAEALLTQITKADPNDIGAWFRLGDLLYHTGYYERARLSFERVLALNPKDATARVRLAVAVAKTGTPEAGERACLEVLSDSSVPPDLDLLATYAQLLVESGRPAQALPYMDRAVALAPQNAVVRSWRASIFLALDRFEDAEREASQASSLAPKLALPHTVLLRIYRAQSRMQEIEREAAWFRSLEGQSTSPDRP